MTHFKTIRDALDESFYKSHAVHCNADRNMPIGMKGSGCSCKLKYATEALSQLQKERGELVEALAGLLAAFGGYCIPEVDAAILAMQKIGKDRWSMQAQMDKAALLEKLRGGK